MLGVRDFRGPGNKTSLNLHHPFPQHASLLVSAKFRFRTGFPVGSVELLGPEVLCQGHSGGGLGLERICRDPGRVRAKQFGSGGRAERNWAMGSDPKSGAGKSGCIFGPEKGV